MDKPSPSSALPPEAFRFTAEPVQIAAADRDSSGPRRLQGVAYSGQPITNHPYWGTVVFDLASTSAPERVPVLIEHDRAQRAGFCGLAIGERIELKEGVLLGNQHGRAVAEESDAGFPWQMSVHIVPGSIEEVQPGVTATVNGQTLPGPLTIFRQNLIREVSLTPTGYDPNTSALAASLGARSPSPKEIPMNVEQLQAQVTQFQAQVGQLTDEVTGLKASIASEKKRADDAEAALAAGQKEQRTAAVKALFSQLGWEFSDAKAATYLAMDEQTFATVSEQMKGLKPAPAAHLFAPQATDGQPEGEGVKPKAGSLAAAASKFSVGR